MTRTPWKQTVCLAALAVAFFPRLVSASVEDLDRNNDGFIRVAWLSAPQQAGGISAADICSDLESMLKAAKPGKPVRVAFEPITLTRTLMGWWYHPESQPARAQLFSGVYDLLVLAEHDECVKDYPEFFFEGVRAINAQARASGLRTALAVMSKPGLSFRDKRLTVIAETVYRVGAGCGVDVIPAAFAWRETLARNRMPGTSPVRARACAYLTAATVYAQLTGERIPKGALDTYWTTRRTTEALALSAYESVSAARSVRHYSGPFSGVVRIVPRIKQRLKIYVPNTFAEDPLRQNLQFLLDTAFQEWFWKTPSEWYADGFDRYAAAFDLVYGDMQQLSLLADPQLYTSLSTPPAHQPPPCVAVFCRLPADDPDGLATLRGLESTLIEGYEFAKARGMVFVPFQLAWARVHQADAALVRQPASGRINDWLTYMLANMLYTTVTDRYQPPPEKAKPRHANAGHPRGHHDRCARIGFETLRQLATLREPSNALLMCSGTYRIDADRPGFVGIRLLDRPAREARVFCATDIPGVAELSRESLIFTPENFDIEQTVRILPATNTASLFFHVMASVQSEDKSVDGANDLRPFLLNFDDRIPGSVAFDRTLVSPRTGYTVMLRPTSRPCEIVHARIAQNGQPTQEVFFSPDHDEGSPVQLAPRSEDYVKGTLPVTVTTASADRRYQNKRFDVAFRVSADGAQVPLVRVTSPATDSMIDGPAFVSARAEADPSGGISALALFLDHKRLGVAASPVCSAAVEKGPPQSRLATGTYTLWASATTSNGLVVGSAPVTFSVREPLTRDRPPHVSPAPHPYPQAATR